MFELLTAKNFKSLGDFRLELSKFNCLVGMNGAGKSTILQAIDFLSQLMTGRVDDWLEMRDWKASELSSKFHVGAATRLLVRYKTKNGESIVWQGSFSRTTLGMTSESIKINGELALQVKDGQYRVLPEWKWLQLDFTYQGSILSQLREQKLPSSVVELRDELRCIRSLELLAPNLMRKRARVSDSDIGAGGEKLSAFLFNIKGQRHDRLLNLLKLFYPQLEDFNVTSQRSGWKKLSLIERYGAQRIETEARHTNDGLLRVLAILAQVKSDRSLILLDEIENGINPEIVEGLVDALVESRTQVIVTTHSPMILNYLSDDVARTAVQFVYRSPDGDTRARRFFDIPRIGHKLETMGPGEAFVDTDLTTLVGECVALDLEDARKSQVLASTNVKLKKLVGIHRIRA